jgi:WD40 repeat protein
MITFLNDKTDWDLHAAFFESIVSVARLLGYRSLPILEPLVQQGLSSPEETVVCKTIAAVTSVTERKLFDRNHLVKHVKLIAPFLVHPSIWVRYEAVGFLCSCDHQMDDVDMECFVYPLVKPYFKHPVFQLQNELVVLSAMKESVPRGVLDYLLKQQNLKEIFKCLKKKSEGEKEPVQSHLLPVFRRLQSLGLNEHHEASLLQLKDILLKQTFNKQLFAEQDPQQGPRGVIDGKLLPRVVSRQQKLTYSPPRPQLPLTSSSTSKRRTGSKASSGSDSKITGSEDWDRIFGSEPAPRPKSSTKPSTSQPTPIPTSRPRLSVHSSGSPRTTTKGGVGSLGSSPKLSVQTLSKEEMSRSTENVLSRDRDPETGELEDQERKTPGHKRSRSEGSGATMAVSVGQSGVQVGGDERTVKPQVTPRREKELSPPYLPRPRNAVENTSCIEGLKLLLDYKQRQYAEDMQAMDNELVKNTCFQSSSRWVPKGQLVAHVHEHRDSINRVRVLLDSPVFATFSSDGTTKLWDVQKLEGRNLINKAKLSYTQLGGQVKTGVFCLNNTAIAAASSNGNIHIFPIDVDKERRRSGTSATIASTASSSSSSASGNRVKPLLESFVDPAAEGQVVEMAHFTAGGQNLLSYVTTKGRLCGLDLRSNETVWRLTNNPKFGLVLSMAVDPYENWVALGTSLGYHVIWDMRFQLPIRHWQHTGHQKHHVHAVHHLSPHPTDPPSLISAVSGNNEVSVWDMETATRRQMLWASPAPPFGEMTDKPHQQESVRGLTTCVFDDHPVILTGGTDRIVRLWNLRDPDRCCCVVKPKYLKRIQFDYQFKVIEGVEVTKEITQSVMSSSGDPSSPDGLPPPEASSHQHSHIDFVTDLSVVPYKNQQFIVSASRDGVLKLWK